MKIDSPSMSALHAFIHTVRLGRLSRAAEELCVSESAISKSIKRLEDHYEERLLMRSPHQEIQLTLAGKKIYEQLSAPVLNIEQISKNIRRSNSLHEVSLKSVPLVTNHWLMPRLSDFRNCHSDISVEFLAYSKDESFNDSRPHAAILSGWPSIWPDDWRCDYLFGSDVVAICHPLRAKKSFDDGRWKSAEDLLQENLLYHLHAPETWEDWFRAQGTRSQKINLSQGFDQAPILLKAVLDDLGVAVIQRFLIEQELSEGRVTAIFDIGVSRRRGYYLCTPTWHVKHRALETFRHWLLNKAPTIVPG